jgi:hypothetical protein
MLLKLERRFWESKSMILTNGADLSKTPAMLNPHVIPVIVIKATLD